MVQYKSRRAEKLEYDNLWGTYRKDFTLAEINYTATYIEYGGKMVVEGQGRSIIFNFEVGFKNIEDFDKYMDGYFRDRERVKMFLDKIKGCGNNEGN